MTVKKTFEDLRQIENDELKNKIHLFFCNSNLDSGKKKELIKIFKDVHQDGHDSKR